MDPVILGIAGGLGLVVGLIVGRLIFAPRTKKVIEQARNEADLILKTANNQGEQIRKDKELEGREKYLQFKSKFEEESSAKNLKFGQIESKLQQREQRLSQELEKAKRKEGEIEIIRDNLSKQLELLARKQEDLDVRNREHVQRLEELSKLSAEEAKEQLMESMKAKAKTDAMTYIKDIMDEAKTKSNKEAKKIVIQTIQRTASEQTIENTVSVFNLASDDQKGQIIGREGRNIRALEAATGIELIVDDTPEAIIISGFDPVRREIARLSLQRLTADGRIHPARIEEIVGKTKKQLEERIMEIGERTVIELGIHGLHRELVRIVGRMRFRSSYGQNLLQHSKETARLCATMAAELGVNPKLAKRAGLLHDIGKVPEEESELSHALLGKKICEKYGEHPSICNAVGAHHDEIEMEYIISPIVQACDAISGARPGARREVMESYLQRIKDLETLAMSYSGVEKAYAIQAGRELRVMVESEKVNDQRAEDLSFEISQKIQDEMQYPGQVKVTVIRERRAVSIAR